MLRAYVVVLLVLTISANRLSAQTAEAVPPDEIARLIGQLDDDDFKVRQSAVAALVEAGDVAISPLQAALEDKASSPELLLRGREALKQLKVAAIKRSAIQLGDIIEQARLANRGKLDADRLEGLLERLLQIISNDTGTEFAMPVRLKDVADAGGVPESISRGSLIKLDTGRISIVQNSIVLAETAVEISSARDSIIIAGVAASVSSPRNCIVIAGRTVNAGGDKNVVLSGQSLSGSISRNSIVGSAGTLQLSIPRNLTVINMPADQRAAFLASQAGLPDAGGEPASRLIDSPGIVLAVKEPENPLRGVISITQVLPLGQEPIVLFRRKNGDGEYVARANKDICFPDGKPMPELAGWKLVYGSGNVRNATYAVFRKGEDRAVVDVTP